MLKFERRFSVFHPHLLVILLCRGPPSPLQVRDKGLSRAREAVEYSASAPCRFRSAILIPQWLSNVMSCWTLENKNVPLFLSNVRQLALISLSLLLPIWLSTLGIVETHIFFSVSSSLYWSSGISGLCRIVFSHFNKDTCVVLFPSVTYKGNQSTRLGLYY